jgi:hypothetical protein
MSAGTCGTLDYLKVSGGRLSFALILDHLILDFLTIVQASQAGLFDRADMDENIWSALVRLNEAKPFG